MPTARPLFCPGLTAGKTWVGKDLAGLVDPSDRDTVTGMIADTLKGAPAPMRKVRMKGAGGEWVQVEMLDEIVIWDRKTAIMTIIRDISDLDNPSE